MIDIIIDVRDDRWKRVRGYKKMVQDSALAALSAKKVRKGELAIVLADDDFITELNRMYRGKNKPTNVLSFTGGGESLGDIVLSFDTLAAEAVKQSKTFKHHTMHLVVHGVLHLLGYDHQSKTGAKKMEALEIKILERLKVRNPYLS